MNKIWKIAVTASLLCLSGGRLPRPLEATPVPAAQPVFDGSLAILTYNVKGLPWPVAMGRTEALDRIAARLRALRQQQQAPHIIVLQEAFTAEAQSIGAAAGYRYVVNGPSVDAAETSTMSSTDRAYASRASWWKGETEGKIIGSGLQILSDYPITAVHRMVFPAFACAGFDCLANKGAMLVTVAIPGAATPVDILTTHLNSRHAAHVDDARSIYAYRRQVAALTDFVRRAHDPRYPLIAAGDFNVGTARPRRSALLTDIHTKWVAEAPIRDALNQFLHQGGTLGPDAAFSLRRARDWQFYSDGTGGGLTLTGIDVPFGRDKSGSMLSDHVGYVARFRLVTSSVDGPHGRSSSVDRKRTVGT